jgi:hypothetical protein
MDEIKLSDDIIEKIKDFDNWYLTEEQVSLIDKLILNEELKERYKKHGLCEECKRPNTGHSYCRSCKSKFFQQNFKNWTSGNPSVDKFIQKAQLKAKNKDQAIEWIEYDRFEDIEYLAKGGFGTVYKAIWKNNQREINGETKVALKCLHNSQDISSEFLKEVRLFIILVLLAFINVKLTIIFF